MKTFSVQVNKFGDQYMNLLTINIFENEIIYNKSFRPLQETNKRTSRHTKWSKNCYLKKRALEQGLYAHVVMMRIRVSDDKKHKEKKQKYNFQGQSARTKHWFDLDRERPKENFMTREPDFY